MDDFIRIEECKEPEEKMWECPHCGSKNPIEDIVCYTCIHAPFGSIIDDATDASEK